VRKTATRRASPTAKQSKADVSLESRIARERQVIEVALDDLKAQDITVIDLHGKASFADYMVVATGTSSRHTASLGDNVAASLKKEGFRVYGMEGQQAGEWVCVDAGDIVVHIFQPDFRKLYNLEKLWSV
jgi:ribosome-associated protein